LSLMEGHTTVLLHLTDERRPRGIDAIVCSQMIKSYVVPPIEWYALATNSLTVEIPN